VTVNDKITSEIKHNDKLNNIFECINNVNNNLQIIQNIFTNQMKINYFQNYINKNQQNFSIINPCNFANNSFFQDLISKIFNLNNNNCK